MLISWAALLWLKCVYYHATKFHDCLTIVCFGDQPELVWRCRCSARTECAWWHCFQRAFWFSLFNSDPFIEVFWDVIICVIIFFSSSCWRNFDSWNCVDFEWNPDLVAKNELFHLGRTGMSLVLPVAMYRLVPWLTANEWFTVSSIGWLSLWSVMYVIIIQCDFWLTCLHHYIPQGATVSSFGRLFCN